MSEITLVRPQAFDASSPAGNWLGQLFGTPGRLSVETLNADRAVLIVVGGAMAGFRLAFTPVQHFLATPGGAQPFVGAIGEIDIFDADGGTFAIIGDLASNVTFASLGSGVALLADPPGINGSLGADTITAAPAGSGIDGGPGADLLRGSAADDVLAGGAGADTLQGGAGDDILGAGDGADLIDGGDGYDAVFLTEKGVFVEAWFGQPAPAGGIRVDNVEEAYVPGFGSRLHGSDLSDAFFGGAGRDDFDGADGSDYLYGGAGDDTLRGGLGADQLEGGSGSDLLDGGPGNDMAIYFGAPNSVTVDLRINDPQQTGYGIDALVNIESLDGTAFADTLTGNGADNVIFSEQGNDLIDGQSGADFLSGYLGDDRIFGGEGNDTIQDSAGANYLRGDAGNDSINGGTGFDDANGNAGDDTVAGGAGDDWTVGGADNDLLFGDSGNDIVWGNLGNDTCNGDADNDQIRGGQGDDSLTGGAGNDFLSGDRGADTMSGGAGADRFHSSQDAGIDRVLDFRLAEGDRVQLDPGTAYAVSQVGADTIIDMGAGNQMILVGVQMSTLTGNWIFLG